MRRAEGGAKNFEVFRVKKLDFMPKNHIFLMAEGGPKIFGVFRVENYNFTPKNHIFSNGGGRRENFWGISCGKSRFYAKKIIFFPILGGARAVCAPPWIRPCYIYVNKWLFYFNIELCIL